MLDIENMNNDELMQWYTEEATENDLENPNVQKKFIKSELADLLVSSILLIKDSEVIKELLASNLWEKGHILLEGKIENMDFSEKSGYLECKFEFIEKATSKKYTLFRDFGKIKKEEVEKELEPYTNNIKAIYLKMEDVLYLDCFVVLGVDET